MSRNNNTSIHSLNSDSGLGKMRKAQWLILNFLNNSFGEYRLDKDLLYKFVPIIFNPKPIICKKLTESPARFLCNRFWTGLSWAEIFKLLGNNIHACEVGCGSGVYGKRLSRLAISE